MLFLAPIEREGLTNMPALSDLLGEYRHSVSYLESLLSLDSDRVLSKLDSSLEAGAIGLRRCRRLLAHCDHPEKALKFIHVAGTSGKGSVVHMIHNILHQAGFRVGSYLSPHVTTTLERIAVDDGFVPIELWLKNVRHLKSYIDKEYLDGPFGIPSYHELMLAIALMSFRQLALDFVVLEVGIGGTLDSTNVIPSPLAAIITDIVSLRRVMMIS